ncbi:F-spondin precursor [Winogradskyella psychrotolerans RS-3]|uniref:F-spondin n=1 Tax=Winogradskyella psychrotolerans RS-3 TaxID=641526 RepID=S7VWC8_9FLAO|nr:spondin domain-containing protein [Winogradskyella psychrotolerans]EPR74421.1 F-spondin precursor [Winogradskyella psychrotolerans RS-3]
MKKIILTLISFFILIVSNNISAQSFASYNINFTSTWNSNDHGPLPSNAHWSDLVGATHNNDITFIELGGTASPGIKNVAELGDNVIFNTEVQTAINAGDAEQWLSTTFDDYAAISSATLVDVILSEDFPLLTLTSMIAPSPDWIIAVSNLDLWDINTNNWKETFTIDLYPYDAGTKDGFNYSGDNIATDPSGVITNVAGVEGYPFNSEKIGTLTITLIAITLSTEDFNKNEDIKLFPNPNDTVRVTITNSRLLNSVIFYDLLGKQVMHVDNSNNKDNLAIDISNLNKGVYIVQLENTSGSVNNKRLIVN